MALSEEWWREIVVQQMCTGGDRLKRQYHWHLRHSRLCSEREEEEKTRKEGNGRAEHLEDQVETEEENEEDAPFVETILETKLSRRHGEDKCWTDLMVVKASNDRSEETVVSLFICLWCRCEF